MYYRLSNSSGTLDVGQEYPQVQEAGGSMKESRECSIYDFPHKFFPSYFPNLDYLILHPKSNLTDFISAAHISRGYIVSDKTRAILQKFNLPEHKFYPANIFHKNEMHNYWWFTFLGSI